MENNDNLFIKSNKEQTIKELLYQRQILVNRLASWFCRLNQYTTIPQEIDRIDRIIKQIINLPS